MKTYLLYSLVAFFSFANSIDAQNSQYYIDKDNHKHFCGKFSLDALFSDTLTAPWVIKEYDEFILEKKHYDWKKNLENVQVTIFLGTWCGDSRVQVPRFIKIWDMLGLKRSQINVVAVYDGSIPDKYKQSPTGEEKKKGVHRVPVFIFERNNKEFARIVESPRTDMLTDIAQIALGYPSAPNYKGASYLITLLDSSLGDYKLNQVKHDRILRRLVSSPGELNTLGYVYLESGRTEEAFICFALNSQFFPFDINAFDSYAEAYLKVGNSERAIDMYERILLLDRSNQNARNQLANLKKANSKN